MNERAMDERFIAYIWFNKLFDAEQYTLLGERVDIVSTGTPNHDAGPDVFNAKVKIDGQLWAGCVEFHVRAGDWHKHNHDGRTAYERVILHVVLEADEQIMTAAGMPIATIRLRYPAFMLDNYLRLTNGQAVHGIKHPILPPTCKSITGKADSIALHSWTDRLLVERLQEKTGMIEHILSDNGANWEEAFYVVLCRAMGFGKNSDAMQSLAQSIPFSVIAHHRDNPEQIEALLLGQAGMLDDLDPTCETETVWKREYKFLANKFQLQPSKGPAFKMMRMRPMGFPTMRIAQTAAILHHNEHLLRRVLESPDTGSLRRIFSCKASDYWTTHYMPGRNTRGKHSASLSANSTDILIINTVVPFLFIYGKMTDNHDIQERATELLHQLPPERNSITEAFASAGLKCASAYDTQALLCLHRNYCQRGECLRCYFGLLAISGKR